MNLCNVWSLPLRPMGALDFFNLNSAGGEAGFFSGFVDGFCPGDGHTHPSIGASGGFAKDSDVDTFDFKGMIQAVDLKVFALVTG